LESQLHPVYKAFLQGFNVHRPPFFLKKKTKNRRKEKKRGKKTGVVAVSASQPWVPGLVGDTSTSFDSDWEACHYIVIRESQVISCCRLQMCCRSGNIIHRMKKKKKKAG
jgi:hypothetical protein